MDSGWGAYQPFLFVIPAEPRQRREPESITTASGYGFRARGLRPRPGMTSQNLRGWFKKLSLKSFGNVHYRQVPHKRRTIHTGTGGNGNSRKPPAMGISPWPGARLLVQLA